MDAAGKDSANKHVMSGTSLLAPLARAGWVARERDVDGMTSTSGALL
jgi:hypothetical protein